MTVSACFVSMTLAEGFMWLMILSPYTRLPHTFIQEAKCLFKMDKSGNVQDFSYCQLILWKDKKQWWMNLSTIVFVAKAWKSLCLCVIDFNCCPKSIKTHQCSTLLQRVTAFFITMNTSTVSYFESCPHTVHVPAAINTRNTVLCDCK